jgi:shikimate dehydrogenase
VPGVLQEIVCCLGQPVAGNPTQFMMERAFAAAGLDWRYLTLEVPPERLVDAVRGLRGLGFRGANVTLPHQVAAAALLDELTPSAAAIGAVNCVTNTNGKLVGENTDGRGFVESLRAICEPAGKRIVVLGAGGAAHAVAIELARAGAAAITIVNRTAEHGEQLAGSIAEKSQAAAQFVAWQGDYSVSPEADVVVNATSIGLNDAPARVPVAAASFRPGLVVADIVFNPPQTRFLRDAAAKGCQTLGGLGMLVNQAVIGFKLWTGLDADASVMREAIEEFLEV